MIPDGRTMDYAIWRACERFGIRPPKVAGSWEECNVVTQAMLLSFDQIRQIEDTKQAAALAGVRL